MCASGAVADMETSSVEAEMESARGIPMELAGCARGGRNAQAAEGGERRGGRGRGKGCLSQNGSMGGVYMDRYVTL